MNHIAAVCGRNNLVCMAGNDGGCACAQTVDVNGNSSAVAFQHIANGLCGEYIATARVHIDCDLFYIAQIGKIFCKLLRGDGIAPPAFFCDIAVKQKFRFLVIIGQIAELPEVLIYGFGRRCFRLIHDSEHFLLSQYRPPPFSSLLQ